MSAWSFVVMWDRRVELVAVSCDNEARNVRTAAGVLRGFCSPRVCCSPLFHTLFRPRSPH